MPIAERALRRESSARVVPVAVLGGGAELRTSTVTSGISSHGSDSGAAEIWGGERFLLALSLCFSCQLVVTVCQSR